MSNSPARSLAAMCLSLSNRRGCDIHNPRRQGGTRCMVSRRQMYEMRYRIFINGWSVEKVAAVYKLDRNYVRDSVFNYRTLSGVVPVRRIKPEDFECKK